MRQPRACRQRLPIRPKLADGLSFLHRCEGKESFDKLSEIGIWWDAWPFRA
jgi:hypothetical protein